MKKLHQLQGLDDKQFDNEFRNLRKVHHKNVVKLVGYCYELKKKYVPHEGQLIQATVMERILCFEFMHGGTLHDHIKGMMSDSAYIDKWFVSLYDFSFQFLQMTPVILIGPHVTKLLKAHVRV